MAMGTLKKVDVKILRISEKFWKVSSLGLKFGWVSQKILFGPESCPLSENAKYSAFLFHNGSR